MCRTLKILIALGTCFLITVIGIGCGPQETEVTEEDILLNIEYDQEAEVINVFISDQADNPLLTHHVGSNTRPYLHPIVAPDGESVITKVDAGNHPYLTGLFWALSDVNGRDFFQNTGDGYWNKVSASVIDMEELQGRIDYMQGHSHDLAHGHSHSRNHNHNHNHSHGHDHTQAHSHGFGFEDHFCVITADVDVDGMADQTKVVWQTTYDLLDENDNTVLTETQVWSMIVSNGEIVLDLEWQGEAKTDVTVGESEFSGLFLHTPAHGQGSDLMEVVTANRERNENADGDRAMWLNVGLQMQGIDNIVNAALFDHSENADFPYVWSVNNEVGVNSSRARMGDWSIEEGETEVIRYRVVLYTGEMNDEKLSSDWESWTDQRYSDLAFARAQQAELLSPTEAADAMTTLEGYSVNSWANEPDITTPMAFAWDDRGRMWVAENNDYIGRFDGFSGAGDSRIVILEDTNGDGYADETKVFMEGIAFPSAIAVGFDGLYLGAPPNLLYVPINDDDTADLDNIEVLLSGWGIDDRHEVINSLHWGPDGWLYGNHGVFTHSKVGPPKDDVQAIFRGNDPFPEDLDELTEGDGVEHNASVWRYHPTKDRFEVVIHGISNQWGIDHDAKGNLFATACVIPHLWHIVPGGIYHRQSGPHFNPYAYDDIKTIADHRHRSAHGGASIYLSDAFPEEQHGRIFMANMHEHRVLTDILNRSGSGFTAPHGDNFINANNEAWVGFSTEVGPEGALYVLDWHDADICGREVLSPETGRIFRITYDESHADEWEGRYDDVSQMTDAQLVNLQTRNSAWHARRARVNLQARAHNGELEANTHDLLRDMYETHANPDWRLRAMWALHLTDGFTQQDLLEAMDDEDEHVRAWAVQLLAEDYAVTRQFPDETTIYYNWGMHNPDLVEPVSEAVMEAFLQAALDDDSPQVRLNLASALYRLDLEYRWELAENLMTRSEDVDDHNIPKMIWFGFEPLFGEDPNRALAIAGNSDIPLISEFSAQRAVDGGASASLLEILSSEPKQMVSMLEGMRNSLEGRYDLDAIPSNWSKVYEQLQQSRNDKVVELVEDIRNLYNEVTFQYTGTLGIEDR